MHTNDKLADALLTIGLMDMSLKARGGYYHDFLSPLAVPEMQLLNDLTIAAKARPDIEQKIFDFRNRVINGEFDASAEESEEWAQSEDGQDTFRRLIED
jgi:hypothetical protein